uniref:Uncharacterized protein MANES_04G093600 n=1 Tax=Rhizophora mucronata TaxID=61149 RepID=A0A2P2NJH5_RHIMU
MQIGKNESPKDER